MKKKIITAAVAVLLAVSSGLIGFFAAKKVYDDRTVKRFASVVKDCRADADGVLSGKTGEYLDYLRADINSLVTLCMLDGGDRFDDELRDSLYVCFAVLQSRPEGCIANIRMIYNAADAYLNGGSVASFRAAVDSFNEAAGSYTVTE